MRSPGSISAGETLWARLTLRPLFTLIAFGTGCSYIAFFTLGTSRSRLTLRTLLALGSLCTLNAARSRRAQFTLDTLLTLWP